MQIGAWGDSITYGFGDTEGLGWVGRLRNSFPLETYIEVYNRGVCADTTTELLERFAVEAKDVEPSVVLFAIGINDSRYHTGETGNKVPIEIFESNMRELIRQAKVHTQHICVISATCVDEEKARNERGYYLNEDIDRYNAVLKGVVDDENVSYIDVSNVLDTARDLIDGIHPNIAGYEKLYSVIFPHIQTLIDK